MVIENQSPKYRLRHHKVDEKGARKAITERRPVVARFSWKGQQEMNFRNFYKKSPKAILRAYDITAEGSSFCHVSIVKKVIIPCYIV